VDLNSVEFVRYHVAVGDAVKTGDKVATVKDADGKEHDILAPQPGVVKHIQEHLQEGMLLARVLPDQNLATIGRLPALDVGRTEKGSFAPKVGEYEFKEWEVNVGDTVTAGDPVAVLVHRVDGSEKTIVAGKSGAVTQRMEELQPGDVVEDVTKDDDLVTIGRFQEPETSLLKPGVAAEMDDIFDFWIVKKGERVHSGDPIAQVSRQQMDGSGRRLAAEPIKIPSPGTGTVDYEADLKPGVSIRNQSVGPTIARIDLGWPWWLTLLAALLVLCCCFCCLFQVMQKPKPTYEPMPVQPEPEPPRPEPEEEKPDGLRLDFNDRGTIKTVYAKYRPLGIKHNFVAPIIAHDFTINSYAKQELGVKDGWELTRIDEEELNGSSNFERVNGKLSHHLKDFPLWPLPLEFRRSDSSKTVIEFVERPIGLEFTNVAPIEVRKIYDGSPAQRQGVELGWVLTKIGECDVHENHDFRQVMKVFKEGVDAIDDSGKRYN